MATVKKYISKTGEVSYNIRAYAGYDRYGRQIEKRMTWKPDPQMGEKAVQKELERQVFLFEEKIRQNKVFDTNTTFEQFALTWLNNNRPPQLAPKTFERYAEMLENINMAIGNIKLINLQSQHLQAFYANLRESGMNNRDNYAVENGLAKYMKENKLTNAGLAQICGISASTVSKAVHGRTSIETAYKLADALEMPTEKLFKIHYSDKGFSEKTILSHHRLISVILRQATIDRLIPYNIATRDYIRAPRVQRKESVFLDDVEVGRVITALQQEPLKWRTAMELLIYSGMRRGELMGLEWKDVDFENKQLHIYRTSQYVSGLGIITKSTKNISSERTIRLPDAVFDTLTEYCTQWHEKKLRMGDKWKNDIEIKYMDGKTECVENDRIFIKSDSTPMNPDSITSWTERFVQRHDLPKFSPHSLRHTNASLLIANGVNIPTVSKRLGHSTVATTTRIYSHAIQSADEKAADVLAEKLDVLRTGKENEKCPGKK